MDNKKIGFLIFFIYLILNLLILKDYGLSWDYHYHHYAGLYHLGLPVPSINSPSDIPFSLPDPRLTTNDPFGPFTQIIPSLSQVLLSENLPASRSFSEGGKILPPDISYNLPMVFFGALGVLVLYLFLLESFNLIVALTGSLSLALNPSYFAYLHNNMKDIPNAFAFALSLWLFWRLVKFQNIKSLILAILSFAFAFNIKINSVFIPVICGLYYLLIFSRAALANTVISTSARTALIKDRFILLYFLLAPLLALLVWWPFWNDPLAKLLELPKFYSQNTYNMPVLFFGKIYRSGINIPPIYPYVYLGITTPLPVLILSLTGLLAAIYFSFKKKHFYTLVLLWFFVPLFRYLSPKTGAIDGVRHFMEVLYPLSAFAGIGYWFLFQKANKKITFLFSILIFAFLVFNLIKFHPYQASFFNSLVGGIPGAQGKFDIDFWATPQKEAAFWLNKNAPLNSYVHIVMGQSTSSLYLRPDLLNRVNKKSIGDSDYIVLLNRQSFFGIYGVKNMPVTKQKNGKIVFQKSIDGVALVWVFIK